jgi:quercetin 2,3-dioxygenase
MISLVPFASLGGANHGWLDAKHHFSFAEYQDPARVHFGPLRVWNDDRIAPHTGFGMHPHRDMEIVTYVRRGAITHGDHLGNRGVTPAGDVQVMSAGHGVMHSERNDSDDVCELFQIWVFPRTRNRAPRWEQRAFPKDAFGVFLPLASGDPRHGDALFIDADATLFGLRLRAGESATLELGGGRIAYAVAVAGSGEANGTAFAARDGVAVEGEPTLTVRATEDLELCLFELPGPASALPAPR